MLQLLQYMCLVRDTYRHDKLTLDIQKGSKGCFYFACLLKVYLIHPNPLFGHVWANVCLCVYTRYSWEMFMFDTGCLRLAFPMDLTLFCQLFSKHCMAWLILRSIMLAQVPIRRPQTLVLQLKAKMKRVEEVWTSCIDCSLFELTNCKGPAVSEANGSTCTKYLPNCDLFDYYCYCESLMYPHVECRKVFDPFTYVKLEIASAWSD